VRSSNSVRIPDNYKAALSQMIAEGIPIPCKDGEPIHLQNQNKNNETTRICLFLRLSFSAPGFFYYTTSNNEQIWIEISLEQDISSTFTDEASGSEIVYALNPNASNLHNAEERADDYSYIGDRIITTSNGDKNALYKMGTDNREYFTFMQNGYVVELFAKPNALTDKWFEDFSIELMHVFDVHAVKTGMSRDQVHQILGTPNREVGNVGMIDQYDIYNDDALTIGYHLDHEGTPRVAYSAAGTDPYDCPEEKGMYIGMSRSDFNTIMPDTARTDFAEYSLLWPSEDWIMLAGFSGETLNGFDAIPLEVLSRSPETFAEIKKGMSIFEVVSRMGYPDKFNRAGDSDKVALDCTVFRSTDGLTYEIYWTYDESATWIVSDIVASE